MPVLTVDQIYQTQSRRTASRDVRIGGVSIDHVQTVDYGFGIAQVPTATIRVRGAKPNSAAFHATVAIDAGFNGVNTPVFRGRIDHIDPDGPDTVLACMGETQALDIPYQKLVYTFTNVSSQQAITDMLANAGVTAYQVNMPTPLWQIGTVVQPTLTFQTWGEAIMKVAEVEGAAWFEFPDGVTRIARVDPIPSLTAQRQIFSMKLAGVTSSYPTGITQSITVGGVTYPTLPHIRQPRAEQQIREVKNEVFVRGVTLNVPQGDGTVTPLPLEVNGKAPSPWVLKPDGSQNYNDYIFTSELLDTAVKCVDVETRLLGLLNRLTYKATIVVDWDPSVIIGATYQVEDPQFSGMTGNWFVVGYQSSMAETDASTTITLIGGAQAGGQGNISPFAFFVYDIEREVIGTKTYAIVTLNGLLSKDFDGPSVTYSWSDNQGFVSGTTAIVTVRIDPTILTNPWIVTLTVTDNMGATGSLALTISIDSTADHVSVPAVFAAFDNYFSATPDGGQTWNDQAVPGGKNAISVSALARGNALTGTAFYGTQQGDIYQTTNYCASALTSVLSGLGSPVVHFRGDVNNIHHIYAVTQDGRVYRSTADGAAGTWVLYDDLRIVYGLPSLRAARIALPVQGGIWIFGGEGNGRPLIAIDPVFGHNWFKAAIGGDLAGDLGIGPATASDAFQIASGIYTGDNTASRAFTGLGFRPDLVIIKRALTASGSGIFRSSNMPAGDSFSFIAEAKLTAGILSLDADGFTIGNDGEVNSNIGPGTYRWVAIRDKQGLGVNMKFGSYVGDGAATKAITGVGFTPAWMWVKSANSGSSEAVQRQTEYTGTDSRSFAGDGTPYNTGNALKSLDADGFTVGNRLQVNRSGETIYYVAFRATNNFKTGSYVGNGATPRAITTPGITPDFVSVRGNDPAASSLARFRAVGTGWPDTNSSGYAAATIDVTDAILSLDAAGFTVGNNDDVNSNGNTFYWVAFDASIASSGAGPADLYIAEAASREAGVLAIILNSATYQPSVYTTADSNGDGSKWRRATGLPAKSRGRYIGPDLQQGQFLFAYDDTVIYRGDMANDVMQATVAPAALQAGDAVNHGIYIGDYIGGIANSYLLAAEGSADGTIWKTWDRAGTLQKFRPATGFPNVLAGMNAKQISIGDPANVTLDFLIAAYSPIGGSNTYPRRIGRLDATWTNVTNPASVSQPDIGWMYHIGAAYYRLSASANALDAHMKPCMGQMQRSTDLITWTDVGPTPSGTWGIANMDQGADGTLWACAGDYVNGSVAPKLYKSTDGGLTWPEVTSIGGVSGNCFVDVACHPTNKDYVVIVGDNFPGVLRLWKTTNATGAATFVATNPGNGSQSILHTRQGVLLQSGRLVIVRQAGGDLAYTDNFTTMVNATGIGSSNYSGEIYRDSLGAVLFFAAGGATTTDLYRSRDGGQTWQLLSSAFGTGGRAFPSAQVVRSMLYDEVQDRLYVGSTNGYVFLIPNAASATVPVATSAIFDITLNLQALWAGGLGPLICPQGFVR